MKKYVWGFITILGIILYFVLTPQNGTGQINIIKKKVKKVKKEKEEIKENVKIIEKKIKELKGKNKDIDTELAKKVAKKEITTEEALEYLKKFVEE